MATWLRCLEMSGTLRRGNPFWARSVSRLQEGSNRMRFGPSCFANPGPALARTLYPRPGFQQAGLKRDSQGHRIRG